MLATLVAKKHALEKPELGMRLGAGDLGGEKHFVLATLVSVALISASLLASRAWLGKLGAQPAEHQRESAWLLSVASRGALHASMAREGCRRARRAPCLRTALHRFSAARSLRPSKSLDIGVASKTRISPPAVRAVRAYLGSWVKT